MTVVGTCLKLVFNTPRVQTKLNLMVCLSLRPSVHPSIHLSVVGSANTHAHKLRARSLECCPVAGTRRRRGELLGGGGGSGATDR